MDFSAVSADDLRVLLAVMLAHMQLLEMKRLSDTGRQRLAALDARTRTLIRLLDTRRARRAAAPPVASIDLGVRIGEVMWELDDVLSDEASRPV